VPRCHGVVTGVAENLKAFLHKNFRRGNRRHGVGKQGAGVGEDFEFDPVGPGVLEPFEKLAAQPRGPERFLFGEATRRVGQDRVAFGVEKIEQVPAGLVEKTLAAHGHGHHLGPAGFEAIAHQFERRVFACPHKKSTSKRMRADRERFGLEVRQGATTDERHDFEHIAIANGRLRVSGASDQPLVQLHGDMFGFDPEIP